MKRQVRRLSLRDIRSLAEISASDGFPYALTEEEAAVCCRDKEPCEEGIQTYGVFLDEKPVSVMTATFCRVFPYEDSPAGRIVHISGAFTLPEYRRTQCASDLLRLIEAEAVLYGADYLCCDSTADGLYRSCGFEHAPENETRMWKRISE